MTKKKKRKKAKRTKAQRSTPPAPVAAAGCQHENLVPHYNIPVGQRCIDCGKIVAELTKDQSERRVSEISATPNR